ncbi:MAG: hypothetical protein GY913_10305 [Proteobacteria bacterium]|nr:hypothetical protein [Pseudomonadota bacterium]MCP4917304.1 hypothetical protein [Pseudomonadota bacterium]
MSLLLLACTAPSVTDSSDSARESTADSVVDSDPPEDTGPPECDTVTFEGEDWTDRFQTGEVVTVDTPGTLTFCDGDWFVLLHVTSQVVIEGMTPARTTLSGGEQGTVVHVTGEGAHASIQHATLDRGYARGDRNEGSGAGIRCDEGADVSVRDAVLSNHDAYDGAGLYARDGCDVQLDGVAFVDNYAEDDGAALRINKGSGELRDVTFTGSTARDGGAVVLDASDVLVDGAVFESNTTRDSQGGAILAYWSTLSIRDAVFEANDANSVGAALALFGETTLEDVTFRSNTAFSGGVVHVYPDHGALTCTGCAWESNTPADLGVQAVGTFEGLADFVCDGDGCR